MNDKPHIHPKKRRPERCINCPQIFQRHEAVCWRCGSCQKCGEMTPDKFGNECIHCLNYEPIPRHDTIGPTHKAHQHHSESFQ